MNHDDISSGNSDSEMGMVNNHDDQLVEEIEYTYDPNDFEGIHPNPNFVNQGELEWKKRRFEWLKTQTNDTNDIYEFDIDVENVMICLQGYKTFPKPVPLNAMVEILSIVWQEGDF